VVVAALVALLLHAPKCIRAALKTQPASKVLLIEESSLTPGKRCRFMDGLNENRLPPRNGSKTCNLPAFRAALGSKTGRQTEVNV